MGALTPLGLSVSESWEKLLQGCSGVRTIKGFDTSTFSTRIWAPVENLEVTQYLKAKDARKMDKFIQLGVIASMEAVKDSGLEADKENEYRIGVAVGSGIGGLETINQNYQKLIDHGPRRVSPFFIPAGIINMVAGQISIQHHFKGPNISIVSACTTGTHNIGAAGRLIAYGDADVMLAGGTEASTTPLCLAGFSAARALSKRNHEPEKASRPFDKARDGFVLGEGAAILVLEEYEHAKRRGAKIYAELLGFGMSADAYHITSPDETAGGSIASMQGAIRDARINKEAVDYINAHGTSTKMNDINETRAIKKTFSDHAYKLAISSNKSMIGHLLGAAGAAEAVFSILSIRDQIIPPTINLDEPDEEMDLDYVPHTSRQKPVNIVLSNSFGFGGTNGSLIFGKI